MHSPRSPGHYAEGSGTGNEAVDHWTIFSPRCDAAGPGDDENVSDASPMKANFCSTFHYVLCKDTNLSISITKTNICHEAADFP